MSIGSRISGFAIAVLLCAAMFATANPAFAADAARSIATRTSTVSPPATDDGSGALYSERGAATCMQCHNEAPVTDILKTAHAVKGDLHSPFGQHECESCHGPSAAHATGFAKGTPAAPAIVFNGPNASPIDARNAVCLTCHEDAQRMNWDGSQHQNSIWPARVATRSMPPRIRSSRRRRSPRNCFTCHAQQRAESFEYSHHPMREGKVVVLGLP